MVKVQQATSIEGISPTADEEADTRPYPGEYWTGDEECRSCSGREQCNISVRSDSGINLARSSDTTESIKYLIIHINDSLNFEGRGISHSRKTEADKADEQNLSPWMSIQAYQLGRMWWRGMFMMLLGLILQALYSSPIVALRRIFHFSRHSNYRAGGRLLARRIVGTTLIRQCGQPSSIIIRIRELNEATESGRQDTLH